MGAILATAAWLASTDCAVPLRTALVGGALVLLAMFIGDRAYARRSADRTEQTRRFVAVAAVAVALTVGIHLRAFSQSCARQSACGVDWDLGCSAFNRYTFAVMQYTAGGVAALVVGLETRRRLRRTVEEKL